MQQRRRTLFKRGKRERKTSAKKEETTKTTKTKKISSCNSSRKASSWRLDFENANYDSTCRHQSLNHSAPNSGTQTRIFLFGVFGSVALLAVVLWVVLFLTEDNVEGEMALLSTQCKYLENKPVTQSGQTSVLDANSEVRGIECHPSQLLYVCLNHLMFHCSLPHEIETVVFSVRPLSWFACAR